MARNKLSLKDQLRGVSAALKSKRTPPQFRDGLRRRKVALQQELRGSVRRRTEDQQH